MEKRESKRKNDRRNEPEEYHKEKSYKKRRSRSRTPQLNQDKSSGRKRRHSISPNNTTTKHEKRKNETSNGDSNKQEAPVRKAKETDMLNTRTGGAYIPPARLRMMQAQITDKSSVAYQRLAWEALKKSIHGHINKINVGNIGIIIKELLKENIVRGRGLLCRSVIQAQAASPTFTNVYAALVAAVNSRFPNIGELLLKRLVIQFKRGFKRNDKPTCLSSVSFIAHLVNQKVAHEILALELLTLLVESPSDDSVEVAIAFLKECGQKLTEVSSKGINAIFEMLRNILHEGQLDKRVQYMIEVMFQVWKDGFKDHPALIEELELVPEEEQFTHLMMLDDATNAQDILNVFKFDEKYEENEQKYKSLCKEILGSDAESGEEDGSEESGSEESGEEEEEKKDVTIIDNTETNLVALRRTIYLTINSSLDFEECAHKLMKMQLKPGQEIELCHMFLDCCAEQRTYEKFYGLLAQRFCNLNRIYIGPFEEIFKDSYATAHRLDTNRLRNVSKFFAHLLFTDSISWEVLECVKLNEEDTTSSSRIYIKILFQELAEYMGLKKLNDRLQDPTLQYAFSGIFPRDNPKNTRFSINFFTSIGLGGLTDELREHLKQMPKNVPAPITEINLGSGSSSDSSSSSSSSDSSSSSGSSSSESDEEDNRDKSNKKKTKKNKSKQPQTPEPEETNRNKNNVERWGHDGFYETYGQDARRAEPERVERERSRPDKERGYDRDRHKSNLKNTNEGDRNNKERENKTRRETRNRFDHELRRDTENKKRNDELRDVESKRRNDDNSRTEKRKNDDSRRDTEHGRENNNESTEEAFERRRNESRRDFEDRRNNDQSRKNVADRRRNCDGREDTSRRSSNHEDPKRNTEEKRRKGDESARNEKDRRNDETRRDREEKRKNDVYSRSKDNKNKYGDESLRNTENSWKNKGNPNRENEEEINDDYQPRGRYWDENIRTYGDKEETRKNNGKNTDRDKNTDRNNEVQKPCSNKNERSKIGGNREATKHDEKYERDARATNKDNRYNSDNNHGDHVRDKRKDKQYNESKEHTHKNRNDSESLNKYEKDKLNSKSYKDSKRREKDDNKNESDSSNISENEYRKRKKDKHVSKSQRKRDTRKHKENERQSDSDTVSDGNKRSTKDTRSAKGKRKKDNEKDGNESECESANEDRKQKKDKHKGSRKASKKDKGSKSESDNDSDNENRKRKKDKRKESSKENLDESNKTLGGRYWDAFDLEKKTNRDCSEGNTPE